jgi:hypothetical protein
LKQKVSQKATAKFLDFVVREMSVGLAVAVLHFLDGGETEKKLPSSYYA